MRRLLVAIGALFILAGLSAQAQVTIGVNLSTTGPGASLGIPEKNVLSTFAPSVIGGKQVRYIIYDDASDPTTAVQNVKRLISEDKADIIIGPTLTTSALAVVDVAAENKTPMVAFASATAVVAPMDAKRKWVYKISANDTIYASTMIKHMVKKGVKTVAVIASEDPYGESNTMEYEKLAGPNGIKTVDVEKFKRNDTSVTAQVLRVMKANPDAVFIIAVGTPSALPHLALVERGYKGKIYQSGSVIGPDFLRVGGKAVEGSFAMNSPVVVAEELPNGYPTKPESLKFVKAYEPKFGPRSIFAAQAWDAINILNIIVPKALQKAKPGTPEFRQALRDTLETTRYNGCLGAFKFTPTDHSGVDQYGIAVMRVENATWKLEYYAGQK